MSPTLLRRLLWVAAIASVLPLFAVEVLPFTDVPEHLAVMASIRNYWNPSHRIAEHYELAWNRSQYLLYHLLGAGLSVGVGVDYANRILLAAAGLAQPFAFASLLAAFDRDERLALFAVPLFWNRALVVGFLPFVASVPVLLFAIAEAVRYLKEPSRRRFAGLAALAVALFYLHASAFAVLALVSVVLSVAFSAVHDSAPRTSRRAALQRSLALNLWLLPAAGLAALWWALGRITLHGASLTEQGEVGHMSAFRSARAFSLWTHDVFRSHVDEACAFAYWVAFAVLLVLTMRREAPSRKTLVVMAPVLTTLALYFVVPFRLGAAAMLNVRMAPLLAFFAVLPLATSRSRATTAALVGVFGVSLATSANAAVELRALVHEEVAGVTALFERTTPGARIVTLPFASRSPRAHFPPFIHMGAYHRVVHGGVSGFSFSELPHWPLQFRREAAPPKKAATFWSLNPCVFRNADDGPYYDFALVKGAVDPFRDEPPGPVWRRVDSVKDFTLYAKVLEQSWPAWGTDDLGPCRSRSAAGQPTPSLEEQSRE
ncbi:MAG: hypothetical protein IPG50_08715 [Myxococcales bacterium]|nr:hypothetical protein [Myxococcales bacterium]